MEHYLTKIMIDNVRNLNNLVINLPSDHRKHLILTGKNGSGKTSVLEAIEAYIEAVNNKLINEFNRIAQSILNGNVIRDFEYELYGKYYQGIRVEWNNESDVESLFKDGNLITAYFAADRKYNIEPVKGVENIKLETAYKSTADPAAKLLKYMVHLKTQQSYAQNENDDQIRINISQWFDRFENALKQLLDDDTISLKYDYRDYNFLIIQEGKKPYGFNALSDGYSSVIRIVSDLIMRMDQNWLLNGALSEYDKEGVVLIDELETHLHIELQRKILPFLTTFFPRLQFIVTTHSPYVLTSVDNALVYDLEKHIEITNPTMYSPEDIAEGYFDAENYSVEILKMMDRLRELSGRQDLTEDERAERADLRLRLKNSKGQLAVDIQNELESLEGMANGQV